MKAKAARPALALCQQEIDKLRARAGVAFEPLVRALSAMTVPARFAGVYPALHVEADRLAERTGLTRPECIGLVFDAAAVAVSCPPRSQYLGNVIKARHVDGTLAERLSDLLSLLP